MAQDFRKAARQFIASDIFIRGVRAYQFDEIEEELIRFIEEYHKAICILSTRVYGHHRLSTDQVIKPALRNMPMAKVEFYPVAYKKPQ